MINMLSIRSEIEFDTFQISIDFIAHITIEISHFSKTVKSISTIRFQREKIEMARFKKMKKFIHFEKYVENDHLPKKCI